MLQRMALVLLLVGVCWAQEAQATCTTDADGAWQCCPPGGPCSNGGAPTAGPGLRIHASTGMGYGWTADQLDETFGSSPVAGRILVGVEYWLFGIDLAASGSNVGQDSGAGILASLEGVLNLLIPVWQPSEGGGIALVPHAGYGWTTLWGSAFDTYAGPSFSVGGQLRYDFSLPNTGDTHINLRLFLDANHTWGDLTASSPESQIDAEMFQLTTGVGASFSGF